MNFSLKYGLPSNLDVFHDDEDREKFFYDLCSLFQRL